MNEFDNFNGFLTEKGEKLFNTSNRSMKYGDGLFETIKVVGGELMYWDDHYDRLKLGITTLKLDDASFPKEKWEEQLMKVVTRNYYKYAKLRLTVYRDAPGLYAPMSNKIGYLIEGVRYSETDSLQQVNVQKLGVYTEMKKPIDVTSNCKTTSALIYVMASIYKKEHQYDDVLILNADEKVCETSNSNLFIVKDGVVFTPALSQGCVGGVMRLQVLKLCALKGIDCQEVSLNLDQVKDADEVFLTNAIAGVIPVKEFQGEKKTPKLTDHLHACFKDLILVN